MLLDIKSEQEFAHLFIKKKKKKKKNEDLPEIYFFHVFVRHYSVDIVQFQIAIFNYRYAN